MRATRPPHLSGPRKRVATVAVVVALGGLLAGCGGRRESRVAAVPVMGPPPAVVAPAPSTSTTVIAAPPPAEVIASPVVAAPPPPAPPETLEPERLESVLSANRAPNWNPTEPDTYGFDGDRYLGLLTTQEMDILRLRSRGDTASHLSRFLSEKERENLRRRDAELTEIGAEPLRIGE